MQITYSKLKTYPIPCMRKPQFIYGCHGNIFVYRKYINKKNKSQEISTVRNRNI